MIYVICANDSLEEATKEKDIAEKRLERLAKEHYQETVRNYRSRQSYLEYRGHIYWHIHEVKEVE